MKNLVEKMLREQPQLEVIACIPETEKGIPKMTLSVDSKYSEEKIVSNIPEERILGLQNLFYKNSRKALEEIIRYRFLDRTILRAREGSASLLIPPKYYKGYKNSISFETDGYQIYFNDYAISIFKNTILKLSEKSKRDSLRFIQGKILSGESQHLHLSITESHDLVRLRECLMKENKEPDAEDPINALYYYINLKQDGTLDEGDLKNILELIDVFTKMYGDFGMFSESDFDCVGYNVGSLKVTGIDLVPEVREKVYSKYIR